MFNVLTSVTQPSPAGMPVKSGVENAWTRTMPLSWAAEAFTVAGPKYFTFAWITP